MATYIAGVRESEWKRLQGLPRRKLLPTDIPEAEWKVGYDDYLLREDGAVVAEGISIEIGWLDGRGGVNWTKC